MSVVLPFPPPPPDAHSPFRSRPTTPVSATVSTACTPTASQSASPRLHPHSPSPVSQAQAQGQARGSSMSRPSTPPPLASPGSAQGQPQTPGSHAGNLAGGLAALSTPGSAGVGMGINLAPAIQPISAPPTPVTPTHTFGSDASPMERCRSSEAGCGVTMSTSKAGSRSPSRDRDSRRREPTATSLLLHTYPSRSSTPSPSTPLGAGKAKDPEVDADGDTEMKDIGSHLHLPEAVVAPPPPPPPQAQEPADDNAMDIDMDMEIAPVPTEEAVRHKQEMQEEQAPAVWGMSRWGMEGEEIKPGVRILELEKLPEIVREHDMLDVPSHVLFPWLHGISDDGQKGRDMAAFFGRFPPFEPPSYRGLSIVLAPDHPMNAIPFPDEREERVPSPTRAPAPTESTGMTATPRSMSGAEPRERSETMSTSSGSYASYTSGETEATSPSVADFQLKTPENSDITEEDVQMHPCESKKASAGTSHGSAKMWEQDKGADNVLGLAGDDDSDSLEDLPEGEERAACLIQNSSYCMELFDMPEFTTGPPTEPSFFRKIRLPNQINLRNLNIQPIKYATISDIVMYAKRGISAGVVQVAEMMVQAQNTLYEERMAEWYAHAAERGVTKTGEGFDRPVRYGVWIIKEPYSYIERTVPHLVQLDSKGRRSRFGKPYALFEREIYEAAAMTRACEVAPNFWVGNDMDVPGSEGDGAWLHTRFDLCVLASEMNDMPIDMDYPHVQRKLAEIREANKVKELASVKEERGGAASPATIALRNILSPAGDAKLGSTTKRGPSESRDDLAHIPSSKNPRSGPASAKMTEQEMAAARKQYARIGCSGSTRTPFGHMHNQGIMMDKLLRLVSFLRGIAEGRDVNNPESTPNSDLQHRILVHCHDGYTESTILVLTYIMYTLELTLPEAFLHLQVNSKRSFFLYSVDKPLLVRLDHRLQQDRRTARMRAAAAAAEAAQAQPPKVLDRGSASPTSTSRWKSWSFRSSSSNSDKDKEKEKEGRAERRSRKESSESFESKGSSTSNTSSAAATAVASPPGSPPSGQMTPTPTGTTTSRRWSRESREPAATRSRTTSTASSKKALTTEENSTPSLRDSMKKPLGKNGESGREQVDPKVEEMKTWFHDRRFEGFPSRILPFLYLGNIEHAGNAAMLKAIGVTHVVSVGESLLTCQPDHDPMYGHIGSNTLGNEARNGGIQVLDLTDIRDDGNDPLRPLIARACRWIEEARKENGIVLVHCRVGVSRSASIVIAYMMQHLKLGLIDAYLTCRARRLNVLIQPNLRFFHELFGWEVELAREEEAIIEQRRKEMQATGMVDEEALKALEENKRRICYAFPVFCRDLHYLNRRFLCN